MTRGAAAAKTLGIVAHSAEGAALCFLTACHEGAVHLGPHMHPPIVMSAVPMGLSMTGWETGDHASVAKHLRRGVQQVADAGADFYVCPDNTAHIVLEQIAGSLPIPGLHIADVVCREIVARGWKRVGLPVLDSTRLLAKHAVLEALSDRPLASESGWLTARA